MSEHTFRHFEEPHRPDMFNRDGVVRWEREGSKTLLDKAEEKYYALMAEEADYALPDDKAAAVDEVLKKAHAALVKDMISAASCRRACGSPPVRLRQDKIMLIAMEPALPEV